jgi:hypothetical protein
MSAGLSFWFHGEKKKKKKKYNLLMIVLRDGSNKQHWNACFNSYYSDDNCQKKKFGFVNHIVILLYIRLSSHYIRKAMLSVTKV